MCKRIILFLAAIGLFLEGARGQQPGRAGIVVLSPDGKVSVSALDKDISITDVQTQKKIVSLRGHTAAVTALAISPDGKLLASGSMDKTIALWEMSSGRQLLRLQGGGLVSSLTFSADGKMLSSRTSDKTLTDWDIATGKKLRQVKEKK